MTAFHRIDFGDILKNKFPEKESDVPAPTYKFFNISVSPQIKTHIAASPPKGIHHNESIQAKIKEFLREDPGKKAAEPGSSSWLPGSLQALTSAAESGIALLNYPSPLHSYARSLIAAWVVYKVLRNQGQAIAVGEGELLSFSPEGNLEINIDRMMQDLQAYRILDYVDFELVGSPHAKMSCCS